MNIWSSGAWEGNVPARARVGLRIRYRADVDPEVRAAFMRFADWLRAKYRFPLRVAVYVKGTRTVRAMDGDMVVGTFFEPYSYSDEPYIRLATGDYRELAERRGRDNALAALLVTFAHELTHYFQWINGRTLDDDAREKEALRCARRVLADYAEDCNRP